MKIIKDIIKITITYKGKTKTTIVGVAKWLELRDARFGVAPLDEVTYDTFRELNNK